MIDRLRAYLRQLFREDHEMRILMYYRCRDCGTRFKTEVDDAVSCPNCKSERVVKQTDASSTYD